MRLWIYTQVKLYHQTRYVQNSSYRWSHTTAGVLPRDDVQACYRCDDVKTIQSYCTDRKFGCHPIVDHNLISNLVVRHQPWSRSVVLRSPGSRSGIAVLTSPGSCHRLRQIMSTLPVTSECGPSVKNLSNKNDTSWKFLSFLITSERRNGWRNNVSVANTSNNQCCYTITYITDDEMSAKSALNQ